MEDIWGSEKLYPQSGMMCYFNDSKLPVKPWPNFCREYVHDDPCSTYQIDPKSAWIPSCNLAPVPGQCPESDSPKR